MSRKWHTNQPIFQNDPDAHERMILINLAKEVLTDPSKRRQYDALRAEALDSEHSDTQSAVSCRPKPEPSTVDFGEIKFGRPSVIRRVSIRPDPPDSWVCGDVIDLSPWSGQFWRQCGFERPDPDVVLVHIFESIVPQDLKPGNYVDTATVSFGDKTERITFRAAVLPISPASSGNARTSSMSKTTTSGSKPVGGTIKATEARTSGADSHRWNRVCRSAISNYVSCARRSQFR
jgi:curved DNA-binding protein CbpA